MVTVHGWFLGCLLQLTCIDLACIGLDFVLLNVILCPCACDYCVHFIIFCQTPLLLYFVFINVCAEFNTMRLHKAAKKRYRFRSHPFTCV